MIRFRCPQCTRAWKVELRHAGKKFRCPACFMERTVPDKSVDETAISPLYSVNETVRDTQDIIREQSHVSFRCRICRAGLAAPPDQVGHAFVCPDCDTENIVPEPTPKEEVKEPDTPIEVYGIAGFGGGVDLPADNVFPVYCPICRALMYARDDQIGSTLACPDCDSPVPVRGRPEKPVKVKHVPKVYEGSSTYELLAENRLPPDTQLVPVVCSLCYTRMYATIDQVGQEKECPDCGKMNRIKHVPREQIKTASELFAPTGGYGVGEVAERPKMRVNVDYRTVEGAVVERETNPLDANHVDPAEMAERLRENIEQEKRRKEKKRKKNDEDDEDEPTQAEKLEARAKKRAQGIGVVTYRRTKLPKRPLTKGFWKLFRYMSTHVHLVIAMLFFFLAAPVMVQLFDQNSFVQQALEAGDRGAAGSVVFFMFMGIFVYTMLMGGLCYLSQICMAVSMSTANGADEVDDWGGFSPFLALSSLICVGGAVAVGWAPVILWKAALYFTRAPDGVPGFLVPICAMTSVFVFPVALLRFLEGFDKHVVKSNALWSLRLIPGTWLRFFLLSVAWLVVPSLLIWGLFFSPDSQIRILCSFGVAFFLPFCSLCYFRLFGRLAWAVEVAVGKKLKELEDLAAAEENDWDDEPERSYDARIDLPDYALRD